MFAVLHIADFALHAVLRFSANLHDDNDATTRTVGPVSNRPSELPLRTRLTPSSADASALHSLKAGQRPTLLPAAALFNGTTKRSVVVAINNAARAAGVELGMSSAQAVARCASLLIRTPNAEAETEARAALLAAAFSLSPLIEDTAPGVCTIALKGANLSQLAPALTNAIAELTRLGLPATAGVARTPLLALYAAQVERIDLNVLERPPAWPMPDARWGQRAPPAASSRFLSATDESAFLAPLPLSVAQPDAELADVFARWGLRTLGDFTALPRDEIVRRFGAAGLAFWQRATGGEERPLRPVMPPQTFVAQTEFEHEIETLEPLLFTLRRFLDRLALELRAQHRVAAELHLTLRLEDDTQHARSFRLPEPTANVEILFRALHTHLESLQTAASIVAAHLRITPTRPLVRQQDIFETGLRDPHGFAETLARLAALLGAERIGTPQLEDSHRPDAVQLTAPAPVVPPPAKPALHAPLGLPLRRFRPPRPARVSEMDGAEYLWADDVSGEICFRSPPYPSNGHWWQADLQWARIEWDIALTDGGLYRLLRIGDEHFIEGEYD